MGWGPAVRRRGTALIPCRRGFAERATGRAVLASGFWLRTERQDSLVLRRRQPWCPRPLGEFLLNRLVARAQGFGGFLPVRPLRAVRHGGDTVLLQAYAAGAYPLRCLGPAELGNREIVRSLCRFWTAVEDGWRTDGWLPDIGGRVYLPWELYRPLKTDNVVVDMVGDCWLVDVGASAVFHSARSPLARLHAALMLRAVRQCRRRLGRGDEGPCR